MSEPIGVTAGHPIWSETRLEFVDAGELEVGEEVLALNGKKTCLSSITPRAGPETVYNFEVANQHVYYVTQNGLLVHNALYAANAWNDFQSAFKAAFKNSSEASTAYNLKKGRRLKWGDTIPYKAKAGGPMTAMRHIMQRHGPASTFTGKGKFASGTTPKDVYGMVQRASKNGDWTFRAGGAAGPTGGIIYDFGKTIGKDSLEKPTSKLTVYFDQLGRVTTAFPDIM